ncbi:unnamed protein product [Cuscuta campestris]|uniref:Phytocyanin domain-containing protein n=1 Tax=Cuscuta campestris TaxID=132261 RepID=A0A484LR04_9ASTE|nr:unnamed protein product [Cuscuta campestris]
MYERNNAMGKASLIRKLVKLQYKDGDSIVVHMNEFQGVVNQLAGMKMKLEDELQALLLLSSLPDRDTLVVSLSNSAPDGKMTMEMVKASLLNEEARRKESGYPSQSEANVIPESSRGRSKSRNPHHRDKSRGRSKSRKRDFICHYCQKPGHIERFCRKKKRDMSRERKDKNENSEQKLEEKNTTALASSDDDLFVIGGHGLLNVACDDCTWVIDSGASYHIISHREYFSSYTSGDFGHVRMGNDGSSKIIGMGDVCLETSTGCRLVLRDVRHVPDIRLSLISAGLLDDEGYANKFCDGRWKLSKGSLIMARGKKQNSLYVMQARVCSGDANVADDASEDEFGYRLWDPRDMKVIRSRDVVFFEDQTIEDCEKKQANPSPCITVDPVPSLPPVVVPQDHGGDMHDHTVESPADDHHDDDNHDDGGDGVPESQPQSHSEPPPAPQLRRSTRVRKPSTRLSEDDFVLVTDGGEPETYDEAMSHVHGEKCRVAVAAWLGAAVFSLHFSAAVSNEFSVGGEKGWVIPKEDNPQFYNDWASKNRFKVDDTLKFEYRKDSVLEVSKEEYEKCRSSGHPIFFDNREHTSFKLDRSGLFYFISGVSGHRK